MTEKQIQQSLTKHRIAITKAQRELTGKSLYLEIALLGDDTYQQERMRGETYEACDVLIQTVEALKAEYLQSTQASLREESQLL